jgi:hypothetical protein
MWHKFFGENTVIKSSVTRWARYVVRMGTKNVYRISRGLEKPEGRSGIDGRIILKWILKYFVTV